MKSFGGIPNEDELIPLMQSQQDKVLEEINQASEDILRSFSDGHNEVLESVNYVLEQSTTHKRDIEKDLKVSLTGTAKVHEAVEDFYTATQAGFQNVSDDIVELQRGLRGLAFMLAGSILLNVGTFAVVVYAVLGS